MDANDRGSLTNSAQPLNIDRSAGRNEPFNAVNSPEKSRVYTGLPILSAINDIPNDDVYIVDIKNTTLLSGNTSNIYNYVLLSVYMAVLIIGHLLI